jgi:hypothetical protein
MSFSFSFLDNWIIRHYTPQRFELGELGIRQLEEPLSFDTDCQARIEPIAFCF